MDSRFVKACSKCEQELDRNGSYCKSCHNKSSLDSYHRNKHTGKNAAQRRVLWLKKLYGLTPEQYTELFERQNGVCAICQEMTTDRLHIDHCHETGRVRGLLCGKCNKALGLLKDSTKLLDRAKEYLDGN